MDPAGGVVSAGRGLTAALLLVGAVGSGVVEALVAGPGPNPASVASRTRSPRSGTGCAGVGGHQRHLGGTGRADRGSRGAARASGARTPRPTGGGHRPPQGIGFVQLAAFHDSAAARADGTIGLYLTGANLGIVAGNALPIAVGPAWPRSRSSKLVPGDTNRVLDTFVLRLS